MDLERVDQIQKTIQILYPALNISTRPVKTDQISNLPIWIKNAVQLTVLEDLEQSFRLILIYPKQRFELEHLVRVYKILKENLQAHLLVVADEILPKHRPLLVRYQIPFVYKNESLFAPELGMRFEKLKNYLAKPSPIFLKTQEALTPFAIKVAAGILTDQLLTEFSLKTMFVTIRLKGLDFSLSKLSQTLSLLGHMGILEPSGAGPTKIYKLKDKIEAWNHLTNAAVEQLYSEFEHNIFPTDENLGTTLAGELALSMYSNLATPSLRTFAIYSKLFKNILLKEREKVFTSPDQTIAIQVWKEDPRLFSVNSSLNPIELYLSLRKNNDERVQLSLKEMLSKYNLPMKEV